MTMYGLEVIVDEKAMVSRWVFPKCRFTEYEKKDEGWARKLGYGHEVVEPGCYIIENKTLIIHPKCWEELCAQTGAVVEPSHNDVLRVRLPYYERAMDKVRSRAAERLEKKLFELGDAGPNLWFVNSGFSTYTEPMLPGIMHNACA